MSAIYHNFSEKLQNIFEIGLKKCGEICSYKNHSHCKNISKEKNSQTRFCCLCVNLPTVKIWRQSDKFPTSFSFCSVCFKWKNWFEKTALNMSIRRVIFTSGQNLKRPFLCQYLIYLRIFLDESSCLDHTLI